MREDEPQGLDAFLALEAEARRAESVEELTFLIANEPCALVRAEQIFVFTGRAGRQRLAAASAIGAVDRNAPRIRWLEGLVARLAAEAGLGERREFVLPAYCPPGDMEAQDFPFRHLVWMPLTLRDGRVFAGMLMARAGPWREADLIVAGRLAATFAHAWAALAGERRLRRRPRAGVLSLVALPILVAAGFFPVPMTVLAPAEVVPVEPQIIAAPLDGVIERIAVDPDAEVVAGQLLLTMADTTLRSEFAVAEQAVRVAEARLKRVTQAAVADPKTRADLAVAQTELALATARRDYAHDLLQRTRVTAPSGGIAIFTAKGDWIGRPVKTGERLMDIADPARVQLRIDVPVADAVAVRAGAQLRAFLDSDPLHPVRATVRSASFEARMTESNVLAYRLHASIEGEASGLRLGIRGTAQLYGEEVSLAYYLLRRPIAALRQWIGL